MMTEFWEDVKNHPNYAISKSYPYQIKNKITGHILTHTPNNCGYIMVNIGGKSHYLHIIVAKQWIENPHPDVLTEVNHKDYDRTNNEVSNLEWISRSNNRRDRQPYHKHPIEYLEDLPDNVYPLELYNNIRYDRYLFDYDSKRLIMYDEKRFHYVNLFGQRTKSCTIKDVNGNWHTIGWKKFCEAIMKEIEKIMQKE